MNRFLDIFVSVIVGMICAWIVGVAYCFPIMIIEIIGIHINEIVQWLLVAVGITVMVLAFTWGFIKFSKVEKKDASSIKES
jgi:hypothetical protein